MAERAKHAHGSRKNLEAAIASKAIDAFDVLFLSGEDENPAMGWLDKNGNPIILSPADEVAELKTQVETTIAGKADAAVVEEIKTEMATKVTAEEVDAKVEAAVENAVAEIGNTPEKVEYEITDVPVGTLVDYREEEIRIMIPHDFQYMKQNVGAGGDPNTYYITFKSYVPSDAVTGYKKDLGGKADTEIKTELCTDSYGRRYKVIWLNVAVYDENTDTWSYFGKGSTKEHMIGWDYKIDWYNADGVVIASDSIRINLSNEDCHSVVEPYYVGKVMTEVDEKIAKAVEEAVGVVEIVEF